VGGEYLTQRETLEFTRNEYVPLWPPHGADLMQIIRAEAEEILNNHKPYPLPEGAQKKMDLILAEADKALVG
jgi:hypothetical protein